MSFEQPPQQNRENNPEIRRLHSIIQVELMKRWAKKRGLDNHAAAEEWTSSRHFSGTFSELADAEPDIYSRYQADNESTLKYIEAKLYGEEGLEKMA